MSSKKEKLLTVVLVGENKNDIKVPKNIDVINYTNEDLYKVVKEINSKYVVFINGDDTISDNYFSLVTNKVKEEFDCCHLNFILFGPKNKPILNDYELNNYYPLAYDYLWRFIYKKDLLLKLLECNSEKEFNEKSKDIFTTKTSIKDVIITHNIFGKPSLVQLFSIKKEQLFLKNAIYVGSFCNSLFNGYITWLTHIGRAFGEKYKITILYNELPQITFEKLNMYFDLAKYSNKYLYTCENLICTYSTYFYPHNIIYYKQSAMFIHGIMCDFPNARKFNDPQDDLYDRYIAVSELAAKKAAGYFATDDIECILNPYVKIPSIKRKHIRLVSAQRTDYIKRTDRIEKMASIFDRLNIPYTWNLFTDAKCGTNHGGLIFRNSVPDVIDYVEDSDYVVLLSDSESYSYTLVEGLFSNVKVIVTDLEICKELNIIDGKNGFIIPKQLFEPEHEQELVKKIIEIYEKKDMPSKYDTSYIKFDGFNTLFD